jgi:Uma2 family endonuclease
VNPYDYNPTTESMLTLEGLAAMATATANQPAVRSGHFTYADYCLWPDDERWELIDGEAFNMCPAPARIHQEVVVALLVQVHAAIEESPCRVYVAPFDVRLPERDEADDEIKDVVQPDLALICDPTKLDDKGCRGAPDWIVEVLSPHTAAKDQRRKRDLYERHRVGEYWLVHPTDRTVSIYRLEDGRYSKPDVMAAVGETPVAILPGLSIMWNRVFPVAETETG